jgi:hypothetical protein
MASDQYANSLRRFGRWRDGMTVGTLFKIKRYALHDGPGIRTTVFFKGCPLSCRWCHNPEGIDPNPQRMSRRTSSGDIDETVGSVVGVDALVKEIEKDVLFYDESGGGVTFSGGEPLSSADIFGCAAYGLQPPGDSRGAGYQRFRSGGSC